MFVRCDKFFACSQVGIWRKNSRWGRVWEVDSISTLREDRRGTKWSHVQFYLHSSNLKSNGIKNLSFNFNKAEGQVISFERKRWGVEHVELNEHRLKIKTRAYLSSCDFKTLLWVRGLRGGEDDSVTAVQGLGDGNLQDSIIHWELTIFKVSSGGCEALL